jgi:hypothetical protein
MNYVKCDGNLIIVNGIVLGKGSMVRLNDRDIINIGGPCLECLKFSCIGSENRRVRFGFWRKKMSNLNGFRADHELEQETVSVRRVSRRCVGEWNGVEELDKVYNLLKTLHRTSVSLSRGCANHHDTTPRRQTSPQPAILRHGEDVWQVQERTQRSSRSL